MSKSTDAASLKKGRLWMALVIVLVLALGIVTYQSCADQGDESPAAQESVTTQDQPPADATGESRPADVDNPLPVGQAVDALVRPAIAEVLGEPLAPAPEQLAHRGGPHPGDQDDADQNPEEEVGVPPPPGRQPGPVPGPQARRVDQVPPGRPGRGCKEEQAHGVNGGDHGADGQGEHQHEQRGMTPGPVLAVEKIHARFYRAQDTETTLVG